MHRTPAADNGDVIGGIGHAHGLGNYIRGRGRARLGKFALFKKFDAGWDPSRTVLDRCDPVLRDAEFPKLMA